MVGDGQAEGGGRTMAVPVSLTLLVIIVRRGDRAEIGADEACFDTRSTRAEG